MELGHTLIENTTAHQAGRALLARMYESRFGKPMPPIKISPLGKPFFPDGRAHFSISHTGSHVFCALSDRPVGIDAEELDRKIRPSLAEKILSPAEKLRYDQCGDKTAALLRFWVLKEAQGKCTGQGLKIWPTHTDFSPEDPRITISHGCVLAVIQEE